MEFIKKLRLYIKINFVIMLISVSTVSNSKNVFADDIKKFASKLFNHYEYDDKINKYLKSLFWFGNPKANKPLEKKNGYSNSHTKSSKHTFKFKSQNKMIYSFGNGQSFQINPSKVNDKIIFNNSEFSYFELKKDSVYYGINFKF